MRFLSGIFRHHPLDSQNGTDLFVLLDIKRYSNQSSIAAGETRAHAGSLLAFCGAGTDLVLATRNLQTPFSLKSRKP